MHQREAHHTSSPRDNKSVNSGQASNNCCRASWREACGTRKRGLFFVPSGCGTTGVLIHQPRVGKQQQTHHKSIPRFKAVSTPLMSATSGCSVAPPTAAAEATTDKRRGSVRLVAVLVFGGGAVLDGWPGTGRLSGFRGTSNWQPAVVKGQPVADAGSKLSEQLKMPGCSNRLKGQKKRLV